MKKTKFYGIVEGFFSYPLPVWSNEERLNTLRFICKSAPNINTYLYCPKQDPYVVEKWDKPYPPKQLTTFQKALSLCEKKNLKFIYGLNPPLVVFKNNQEEENWLRKTIVKLEQLRSIGCRNFCLLFDDVPFAYEVIDNPSVPEGAKIGKALVSLINTVYETLENKIEEFWLCAPDYCFRKKTTFTRQLKDLNSNVALIWTGDNVFVRTITESNLKRIKNLLSTKRKIIWWSNYPVNDCEQSLDTFNLGGFSGLDKKVLQNLSGVVVNPMRECYANLPFYLSFSDYIYSPKSYNRLRSWQNGLKKLIGNAFKSYEFILQEFSTRNLLDDQPKYLYQNLRYIKTVTGIKTLLKKANQSLDIIKENPPKTLWGKLFVDSVSPVLEKGKLFASLITQILSKKKINKKGFTTFDEFPTATTIPRYFPEIFAIVKTRLLLLPTEFKNQSKEKMLIFSQFNNGFQKKYKGKKKLKLDRSVLLKLQKSIKEAVCLERNLVLKLLNSGEIDLVQKIKILSLRQNINRSTVKDFLKK